MDEPLYQWLLQQIEGLTGPLEQPPQIEPLLVEASQRRFYRISLRGHSLVLMASPPALERNDAFVALSTVFGNAGIPVPEIHASDLQRGWFLMQDLGPRVLREHYGTEQEAAAMNAALALLPRLQAVRSDEIPPYTRERLADELKIFSDWFLERLLALSPPTLLRDAFEQLVEAAADQPRVCVHRDYHCRNLLWNAGTLGVVDFQDALHGPLTYDLASLLHDCYYQWPDDALDRYREQGRHLIAPELTAPVFQRQLEWMAVQRQLKAVGIFVRLKLRDDRASHLSHVLPTLGQIIRLSSGYPELAPMGAWLESLCPSVARRLAAFDTR